LRSWGRMLITSIEYFFVYFMLRVYQKLKSEGLKEYREKQCFARTFLGLSVAIITINCIVGSIRSTI
jgi:hypothetical protein